MRTNLTYISVSDESTTTTHFNIFYLGFTSTLLTFTFGIQIWHDKSRNTAEDKEDVNTFLKLTVYDDDTHRHLYSTRFL